MNRLNEFRKYYNHSIHPELRRLERQRIRLNLLFIGSAILIPIVIVLEIWINNLLITLLLAIPLFLYATWIYMRMKKFVRDYKPRVINRILDFIQKEVNYQDLYYNPTGKIAMETFLESRLFDPDIAIYQGEDFVSGKVGELDFKLCELNVEQNKPISGGTQKVFKGIFVSAVFNFDLEGAVLVWPKKYRQFFSKPIRTAVSYGAQNEDWEILYEPFRNTFVTYATPNTHVAGVLPITMQEAIIQYLAHIKRRDLLRQPADRPKQKPQVRALYLSILSNHIFVGLTEEKDMLEPNIFRSNLSFDLILEYYEQIQLMLKIIEDFDQMH